MSSEDIPKKGPRESHIQRLWDSAWKELSDGGVFESFVAIADADLAKFGATLPPNDPDAEIDFNSARNVHVFQSRHSSVQVERLGDFTRQVSQMADKMYDQISKFNDHTVRSLTFAHGGVVFATLAYIQTQPSVIGGFLWVIGLCSTGYLLTLLGSHLVVALSTKPLQLMFELQATRLSEKDRNIKIQEMQRRNRIMIWRSRPVFYLSAILLVVSLYIGVSTLVGERSTNDTGITSAEAGVLSNISKLSETPTPNGSIGGKPR